MREEKLDSEIGQQTTGRVSEEERGRSGKRSMRPTRSYPKAAIAAADAANKGRHREGSVILGGRSIVVMRRD